MKIYTEKSHIIPGTEGKVYVLETMEDWDEYEKILKDMDPDFLKWNPNFYSFKEEFEKYIGKIWQDKRQLRYMYNGEPVYVEYKIIALQDDEPNMDWYWVVQNVDDDRDIKYVLGNSWELKEGIKI